MDWLTDWKPWAALGGVAASLAALWRALWRLLATAAMTPYREAENAALRTALDNLSSDYERLAERHKQLRARCDDRPSSSAS